MTDIPDLIARVRELDAAATKGPWDSEYDGDRYGFLGYVIVVDTCYEEHATDAALIAYYRTAAPLLADECERLRERVKVLEAASRAVLALADKLDRDGMAEAVSVGDCYARAATRECAAEVRALAETGGSDAC